MEVHKTVQLYDGEELDLASFADEFKINSFDVNRLHISFDYDETDCFYEGDLPNILVTIKYKEKT